VPKVFGSANDDDERATIGVTYDHKEDPEAEKDTVSLLANRES
jgi:hypothetical protein